MNVMGTKINNQRERLPVEKRNSKPVAIQTIDFPTVDYYPESCKAQDGVLSITSVQGSQRSQRAKPELSVKKSMMTINQDDSWDILPENSKAVS
jgi:hypothetical protein